MERSEGYQRGLVLRAVVDGFRPDPKIATSEWADKHRIVPAYSARPGPWRCDVVPFAREIMDAMSPSSPYERVALQKSAQIIGTEAIINALFCAIDTSPGPMMVIQPTVDMGTAFSREKLGPSIEDTPRIRRKVAPEGRGRGGSTVNFKRFPGGFLVITGSNSAKGLRQRSIRYLFKDDLDDFEADVGGQGDPSKLADQRTKTYASTRKIVEVSSPVAAGKSKIGAAYQDSDQRQYHVPCPHCEHEQVLRWSQVKWEKDDEGGALPDTAYYLCEGCGVGIPHNKKPWMLRRGRWIARNPGPNRTAGFHLSDLYSPFCTWADMVTDFVAAKDEPHRLKVFINTRLGEVWFDAADVPDWKRLLERAEDYPLTTCPPGVLFLTAGVDVQGDRLEVQVKGWGYKRTSWTVDYRVIWGNTLQDEVWKELADVLSTTWLDWRGEGLRIEWMAIDTGFNTAKAYEFCNAHSRAMAIKGSSSQTAPSLGLGRRVQINVAGRASAFSVLLFQLGTHTIKRDLFERLRLDRIDDEGRLVYPPGYCHHPKDLGAPWFQQLTNERLKRDRDRNGYERLEWVRTGRNEVLDTDVYSYAAALRYGIERFREADWQRMMADAAVIQPKPQADLEEIWSGPIQPGSSPTPAARRHSVLMPRGAGTIGR